MRQGSSKEKKMNAPSTSESKRKKRYRPGQKALLEIRQLQSSTKLCIRKRCFSRLVREIQHRRNPRITHWQRGALAALQEAAEAYLVRFMEDSNLAANFAKRVTIMQRDFQFINRLRGSAA